eukprot:GHVT01035991.1.p2 GENE.GHVT01035991.1~~GHVT01035991.1.p2  ORF type:complete len:117 (-),score=7.64 GHVT01035991.1:397-747(-)
MWGGGNIISFTRVLRTWYIKERLSFGVKHSKSFRSAKSAQRAARWAGRRRRLEQDGVICGGRKNLMMNLMQNPGIGWYRTMQVLKHLEMHWRAKPIITPKFISAVKDAVATVKKGK